MGRRAVLDVIDLQTRLSNSYKWSSVVLTRPGPEPRQGIPSVPPACLLLKIAVTSASNPMLVSLQIDQHCLPEVRA